MNDNILALLPLGMLPHIISLAFTECLLFIDAYIDIFTCCLQGRVAFLHFTDGKYFPTTSEDTPRLVFFPLHHVIILHYLTLNHPPHLIPPVYSRRPLSTWHTKLFNQVWRSTVNITLQWNSSVSVQSLSLCNPTDCSMPGLPVHHQLPEFTQTHVHWVGDAIQPSHPSPPLVIPFSSRLEIVMGQEMEAEVTFFV